MEKSESVKQLFENTPLYDSISVLIVACLEEYNAKKDAEDEATEMQPVIPTKSYLQ